MNKTDLIQKAIKLIEAAGRRLGMNPDPKIEDDGEPGSEFITLFARQYSIHIDEGSKPGDWYFMPCAISHSAGYFNPRTGDGEPPSEDETILRPATEREITGTEAVALVFENFARQWVYEEAESLELDRSENQKDQ